MGTVDKGAIVLILVGVVLLAGPVFGFSTITADRSVGVNTASDESALLGIHDSPSAPEISDTGPPSDQAAELFYIDDNTESFDSITITDIWFDGEPTDLDPTLINYDGDEHDYTLEVNCGSSDLDDSGEITVAITGSGSVVVNLQRAVEVTVDCRNGPPGSGQPSGPNAGETHDGDIISNGDITTGSNSEVNGNIESDSDITAGSGSVINGNLDADRDVTTHSQSEIDGNINANRDVTINSESTINGDIDAGRHVTIQSNSEVDGNIIADGDVTIQWGAEVEGDVIAGGDIYVNGGSIGGDVHAGGTLTINHGTEIGGDETADGSIIDRR